MILEKQYAAFESTIMCTNGISNEIAALPRFNGNKSLPIHRWFNFKEGFSTKLLPWVCNKVDIQLEDLSLILDPFCGVGTSLLSAQMDYKGTHSLKLVGVERNPFIAFVAQSKLNWPLYNKTRIEQALPKIISRIRNDARPAEHLPALTTIQNQRVFARKKLYDLLFAKQLIEEEAGGTTEQDFFLLGWAAIIETVSNVRKDGRALRFVEKTNRPPIYKLLENQWRTMLLDLVDIQDGRTRTKQDEICTTIYNGDGRTLEHLSGLEGTCDFVVYSPPYPNNIDYSEVYKLELWLSGAIQNYEQFRALRLSTLRSHPSIRFHDSDFIQELPLQSWPRKLLECMIEAIPKNKDSKWRERLLKGYADDMLLSLRNQYKYARTGGYVACVVGNSLHGNEKNGTFCIAADLLIAALAQAVGFNVRQIQVLRNLNRRHSTSSFLRESVVIMQK